MRDISMISSSALDSGTITRFSRDSIAIEGAPDLTIRRVTCEILDIPSLRHHRLSSLIARNKSLVLVRVGLANGVEGIGEASVLGGPRWAEESVEGIKATIDAHLAPLLHGRRADLIEANAALLGQIKRNYSAKAAIETALFDAVGKSLNMSVATLLGGACRSSMSVIWALASGDAEQEIDEARAKLDAREHRTFKVKIGFASPRADIARLQRIAGALGSGSELIVDVNQGWSEADAIRWLPALEDIGVKLIEQPLPASQIAGIARLSARTSIPIMVDESIFTCDDVVSSGTIGAGSVVSLKLVKSGGLLALKRAAAVAEAFGYELYGGCLLEAGIGTASHLHVFASLPSLPWGTEHFGPRLLVQDILAEPLVYRDFEVHLPQGPGLGISLDEERVTDFTRR
jgi:muconate cycloisomerase